MFWKQEKKNFCAKGNTASRCQIKVIMSDFKILSNFLIPLLNDTV